MWNRIRPLSLLLTALVAGAFVCHLSDRSAVAVQDGNPAVANLRERLVSGLRVRTKEERVFIEKVVQGVENNTIPQKLVDQSFFWVRTNKPNHKFPFFYFERVLRLQGKRENVAIPPFSYPKG